MKYVLLSVLLFVTNVSWAEVESYKIDIKGQHAFIQFKVKHLGYSWLLGSFRKFDGEFTYDVDKPERSTVAVKIDTRSLDSNHAERDKHLKGKDFLDVKRYPEATFVSHKVVKNAGGGLAIQGELNLHGVKKIIVIDATEIGRGPDPWLGFRAGFEGSVVLKLADFNITKNLGPASTHVQMNLFVEGVRQASESDGEGSEFFE